LLVSLAALVPCVIAMFLPGSPWRLARPYGETVEVTDETVEISDEPVWVSCPRVLSIYVLLIGVVGARFGIWLSDIAITQIQQEKVREEIRGQIGGVQGALNSTLDLLKYVLVLLFPRASDFGYLVFASFFSVLCSLISYSSYALTCGFNRKSSYAIDSEVTPLLISSPKAPSLQSTPPKTMAK